MHILIFPSWYPEAASDVRGVFFRDQALALKAYGHDVAVISVNSRSLRTVGKPYQQPSPFELDEGVPTYRSTVWAALPRVPYGNYFLWRREARKLFRQYIERHGRPDVIHAHSALYAGGVAAELGREQDIPMVLTEHSSGFARGLYKSWQLTLAARAAEQAQRRLAVSPDLGVLITRQLAAEKSEWDWVPNVVATRFDVSNHASASDISRPVRFLNLALMTENKGQLDLLEAFVRGFGGSDAELWFGGDGPLREQLESTARELGVGERVRFIGMVSPKQVPELLGQIDVMVVASHYETFGVVVAEALMAGRPVVVTRCGGPECIVGDRDGVLVPVGDPVKLAEGLHLVADHLDNYPATELSERARARFSGEAVSRRLTEIYQSVVDEKRGEGSLA